MKLKKFIKDKIVYLFCLFFMIIITFLLLSAFKVNISIIITIVFIIILFSIIPLFIEYVNKRNFYNKLINDFDKLDKKSLISELIDKPNFYEGELLKQIIYEISKYSNDQIRINEDLLLDFKEFIELWIHEIKIPVSGLSLILHKQHDRSSIKAKEQLKRIYDYIEQVLYYARSENTEKDYLIKSIDLNKVINDVIINNKNYLLYNEVNMEVMDINHYVYSDSKWLSFILNQIISNSIKYRRNDVTSYIKISGFCSDNLVVLSILDNGMGISKEDLPRVFDKSFTGENGRILNSSTGMGLYITKCMCNKLGHKISIVSSKGNYTKIEIVFNNDGFYKEVM